MLAGENAHASMRPSWSLRLGHGLGPESEDLHRVEYGCSERTGLDGFGAE